MARPNKQPHELREWRCNVRLTAAEGAHVDEQVRAAGLDRAEYIRRRALGYIVPPAKSRADATLLSDLNRLALELRVIGQNVNQITRGLHTQRSAALPWTTIYDRLQETHLDIRVLLGKLASGDDA